MLLFHSRITKSMVMIFYIRLTLYAALIIMKAKLADGILYGVLVA